MQADEAATGLVPSHVPRVVARTRVQARRASLLHRGEAGHDTQAAGAQVGQALPRVRVAQVLRAARLPGARTRDRPRPVRRRVQLRALGRACRTLGHQVRRAARREPLGRSGTRVPLYQVCNQTHTHTHTHTRNMHFFLT